MMREKIKEQLLVLNLFLNKKFFILLGFYFVFVAVFSFSVKLIFIRFGFFKEAEIVVQQIIIGFRSDFLTNVLKIFTDLGGTTSITFLVLLVAGIFLWKKYYLYSVGIVFSVGVAEFVSLVLKYLIGRGRPSAILSLVLEHSPSFPSGHTLAAISFYGFLMYVVYKNVQNKSLRIFLMFLCVAVILLAGFTRIYLGVHWLGDVMASYILGGVWVVLVIYLMKKQEDIDE